MGHVLYYTETRLGTQTTAQNELKVSHNKAGVSRFEMHNLHTTSWRNLTLAIEDNVVLDQSLKKSGSLGLSWEDEQRRAGVDLEANDLFTGDGVGHIGLGAWFRLNDRAKAHFASTVDVSLANGQDREKTETEFQLPRFGADLKLHKRADLKLALQDLTNASALLKLSLPKSDKGYHPRSDIELCLTGDFGQSDIGYGFKWTGSWD